MPISMLEQLDVMTNSLSRGDAALLTRAIKNPELVTPKESRSVAESMGMSNGFLKFVTNVATDPVVWIAALVARRYPTWLWSRGIPKRLAGAATEFGGLSKFGRPVATMFRGEGIEEMLSLGMHRQARVHRLFMPVEEALASLSKEEKIAMVRFREEGITTGLTTRAREVSDLVTNKFEEAWTTFASQVSDVRTVSFGGKSSIAQSGLPAPGRLGSIVHGPFTRRVDGELVEAAKAPLEFRNYIPHLPILSRDGNFALSGMEALTRMRDAGGKRLLQALQADGLPIEETLVKFKDGSSQRMVSRLGPWRVGADDTIQSAIADWQAAMRGQTGKIFFGHLEKRSRNIPLFSELGQGAFVLDIDQVFANYTRGLAKSYAYNAPLSKADQLIGSRLVENPNPVRRVGRFFADALTTEPLSDEPLTVQMMKAGIRSMGTNVESTIVKGTEFFSKGPVRQLRFKMADNALKVQGLDHLLKSVRGHFNEKEVLFGNAFSNAASKIERVLQRTSPDLARKLSTHFETLKASGTDRAIQNFLATLTYQSTLGLNISSAVGNALQTPLTTMPSVGFGPTMKGIAEFAGRLPRYSAQILRNYRKGGTSLPNSARKAFQQTFPELAEFKINVDPRLFEIDDSAITNAPGGLGSFFRNHEKYTGWVMAPFRAVETMNRSVAFFSARHQALNIRRINPDIIPRALHGPGGSLTNEGIEYLSLHAARTVNATQFLPGGGTRTIAQDQVAPWMRALTSFPLRFLSWMGEGTVRGGMIEREMQIANVGDRLLGGRNFGPAARLILYGNILNKGFRDMLGLDVNRWVGFGPVDPSNELGPLPMPPAAGLLINVGSAINSREWDRARPLKVPGLGNMVIPKVMVPAGVAMTRLTRAVEQFSPDAGGFVDQDDRLMREAGTTDFVLAALGIPTEKGRRERLQLASLSTRIRTVKQFRRKFATSILRGDLGTAKRLREDYGKTFPEMPPLNVAVKDLRTYHANSRIPRMARALKALGNQRPMLERQLIEIDPGLIAPTGLEAPENN